MDSDNSNRNSDILRNVVMGRVTEDGSWTKVGKFSEVNVTFDDAEEMSEEFKTRYLNLQGEESFTAELEPAIAQKIADEIYEKLVMVYMLQITEQLGQTKEIYICYANPADYNSVEIIRRIYATIPLRILNDVVYTEAVEKGKIHLVPVSKIYQYLPFPLFKAPTDTTAIDEIATEVPEKPPVRDISWIRKQMKHCKNPMERKQLERELNAAFKEKKRRRKK